jgi:hypothetical protein
MDDRRFDTTYSVFVQARNPAGFTTGETPPDVEVDVPKNLN